MKKVSLDDELDNLSDMTDDDVADIQRKQKELEKALEKAKKAAQKKKQLKQIPVVRKARSQPKALEEWEIDLLPKNTDCESNLTIALFILDILVMVLNMFVLFGVVLSNVIIAMVGEEDFYGIERGDLVERTFGESMMLTTFEIVPFVISVYFQYFNFWLITLESRFEMTWYLSKKGHGLRVINGCLVFSFLALAVISFLYYEMQVIQYTKVVTKFFGLL